MPKNSSSTIIKKIARDTRNAVETAIDLSKESLRGTWEGRVKKIQTPIQRWVESEFHRPAHRR